MKRFRKILFWCHLIAGSTAASIIFIMSVTGVLLAFQTQILRFAERKMIQVDPAGNRTLPLQDLLTKLKEQSPEINPSGMIIPSDASTAITVNVGRESIVYQDRYTGKVTGNGSKSWRTFFREVTDLHRWLGVGEENRSLGRAVTGACNAAFLFLAISGIYLWLPKKWIKQYLIPIVTFQSGLTGRARDFNWHNVTGIWCCILLIFITATGMVMSYQWANNLLYTLTGNEAPPSPGGGERRSAPQIKSSFIPENLDALFQKANQLSDGWKTITIRFGAAEKDPVSFVILEGKAINPFARSQLTLNSATADIIKWEPYSDFNAGKKLRSWARFVHTGEALGLTGQILACVASLGGAFLAWTGISLALRRFRGWQLRKAERTPVKETTSSIPSSISD
jgi:uncharacterized iron-regulated membrane protein